MFESVEMTELTVGDSVKSFEETNVTECPETRW